MRSRFARTLMYLLGAAFLYASFLVGASWSEAYLTHYGSFPLSRGELALKLHLLLFVLPATIFLSLALAKARPGRLLAAFDVLGSRRLSRVSPILIALVVFGLVMVVRVYSPVNRHIMADGMQPHFAAHVSRCSVPAFSLRSSWSR